MPYQMWINGEHTSGTSGNIIEVRNPATEEILDTAPAAKGFSGKNMPTSWGSDAVLPAVPKDKNEPPGRAAQRLRGHLSIWLRPVRIGST